MKRNKKAYIAPQTELIEARPCTLLAISEYGILDEGMGKQGAFSDEFEDDSETTAASAQDNWDSVSGWND